MPFHFSRVLRSAKRYALDWMLNNNIIYPTAIEDPRQDRHLLELGSDDVVIMITTGGCNVLDRIIDGPKQVHAVDHNPRQNYLLALRLAACRVLSYEEFFALFAENDMKILHDNYPDIRADLAEVSPAAAVFWDGYRHRISNWQYCGSTGGVVYWLITLMMTFGLSKTARDLLAAQSIEEQTELLSNFGFLERFYLFLSWQFILRTGWLVGVPCTQMALCRDNRVWTTVEHVYKETHILKDNYFWYGALTGGYSHECCPRYLKKEGFDTLKQRISDAPDCIVWHTGDMIKYMASLPDGSLSAAILLDHLDWMSDDQVLHEFQVLLRKIRPGGRILWRSAASHIPHSCLTGLTRDETRTRQIVKKYPCRVGSYMGTFVADIQDLDDPLSVLPPHVVPHKSKLSWWCALQVMYHNIVSPIKGKTQAERLESFYAGQKDLYDEYRQHMLHGRDYLIAALPLPVGGVSELKEDEKWTWVDIGAGTGMNMEYMGRGRLAKFKRIHLVDLCPSLLSIAIARIKQLGLADVASTHCHDATQSLSESGIVDGSADLVTFSYSLTMMPSWRKTLEVATAALKPGGYIAVTDFCPGHHKSGLENRLWTKMFSTDHVVLDKAHVETLLSSFDTQYFFEGLGGFPKVPFVQCAFYDYLGKKPSSSHIDSSA